MCPNDHCDSGKYCHHIDTVMTYVYIAGLLKLVVQILVVLMSCTCDTLNLCAFITFELNTEQYWTVGCDVVVLRIGLLPT